MRNFLLAVLLAAGAGAAFAALVNTAGIAHVRVGATIALAACVYFAARMGAPGIFILAHLFGLAFALLGLAANWIGWLAALNGYDFAAVAELAKLAPQDWAAKLMELSKSQRVLVGGSHIEDATLRGFWIAQAAFVGLSGLMGGQSAYELRRGRRRAAQERRLA
ncbi:MAG: hypothetical protein MRY74_08825 [Neomegalonema sp.]|nr:hypothetical protein [Neomegalonema sp.]